MLFFFAYQSITEVYICGESNKVCVNLGQHENHKHEYTANICTNTVFKHLQKFHKKRHACLHTVTKQSLTRKPDALIILLTPVMAPETNTYVSLPFAAGKTNRFYHRSQIQNKKSQPKGKWIMP